MADTPKAKKQNKTEHKNWWTGFFVCGRHGDQGGCGQTIKEEEREGADGAGQGWESRDSAPFSLNEVLLLLLRVRVVALGVDDGRVGVRCVVRSFGLICQICSFMPGQISPQDND